MVFGATQLPPFYASTAASCPLGWRFVAAGRSSMCMPPTAASAADAAKWIDGATRDVAPATSSGGDAVVSKLKAMSPVTLLAIGALAVLLLRR